MFNCPVLVSGNFHLGGQKRSILVCCVGKKIRNGLKISNHQSTPPEKTFQSHWSLQESDRLHLFLFVFQVWLDLLDCVLVISMRLVHVFNDTHFDFYNTDRIFALNSVNSKNNTKGLKQHEVLHSYITHTLIVMAVSMIPLDL